MVERTEAMSPSGLSGATSTLLSRSARKAGVVVGVECGQGDVVDLGGAHVASAVGSASAVLMSPPR